MSDFLLRVVHTLSHNFRNATCIIRAPLRLPIEANHVLVKVIYAGVNASDVSLIKRLSSIILLNPFVLYLLFCSHLCCIKSNMEFLFGF